MTSETTPRTSIYTPFADGRTVRDIVEHTPALVNEAWCRDLLRHTLDSLERQYQTGAPHRPISPDTIVMLANNEPLLLPAPEEVGAAGAPTLAADLHALALVVHYAITAELPPDGPLGPRLYDNYSGVLTNGLDRCLGPNLRLRPGTIADMRALLGIDAASGEQPVHASTLPATAAVEVQDAPPAPEAFTAEPQPFAAPEPSPAAPPESAPAAPAAQQAPAAPDYSQPLPEPLAQEVRPAALAPAVPAAVAMNRIDAPEPEVSPRLHTPSSTGASTGAPQVPVPDKRVHQAPAGGAPGAEPLLRTPASAATEPPAAAGAAPTRAPTALEAATAARLHEEAARNRITPPAPPRARPDKVRRWGWIAGAAIVLLAAGTALVSFLQQSDSRDVAALTLPPAEQAENGLDSGETVVAPGAADTIGPSSGELPAGAATDAGALPGDAGVALTPDAATGAAAVPPLGTSAPGKGGEAVVNGTTYKLLIKPWGTVYVDGVDRGVSPPVKRLTLARGTHTIRIVNPNFPEHVVTVEAGARESTTIEHDFTAKAE